LPPECDQLLPYLLSLEQSAVDGPLNQLHSQLCSKEETKSLLVSLLQKNEQRGKPSVHLQMASSRCHRGNSLTRELDRRFETHWPALESVIQTTLSKLSASGPADVFDRDSFDGLMDSYLDAVAHRMTLTFADSLENLRDELTSSVLANIGSMRHLVQMKERTISMEEIRAELRANGLPLRLETLIGD